MNPCRKLLVYPKGIYNGEMKVMSLFLLCCDCVLPEHKFFAQFKIRIKDQINNKNHIEKTGMCAYMCVCAHTLVPPVLFDLVLFLCKFCLNFFVLFCFLQKNIGSLPLRTNVASHTLCLLRISKIYARDFLRMML